MNQGQIRALARYRRKVNRELQTRHGFAVAVTAAHLVNQIDEGFHEDWEPHETAALVATIANGRTPAPQSRQSHVG